MIDPIDGYDAAVTSMEWDLPYEMVAASIARGHAARWAVEAGWTIPEADDLVLVVSELVANGVRHGRPPVRLAITPTAEGAALVTVVDGGADSGPVVQDARDDEDHGRGLAMVKALSEESGWRRDPDATTVWAQVHRSRP